ncbi:MAG: YbhB/YbcL family Raf kinase inhibitor-like protein [Oscillospiraceae bacterium]|nr:YbhB/YbcL family Raf kinase inhibitor-like protein [Oscillospiraceae bacterium]
MPGGAAQGTAYGRNRYRGPKPPFFVLTPHRYVFRFYALDCRLELDGAAGRRTLVRAMDGHILQQGSLLGTYRR